MQKYRLPYIITFILETSKQYTAVGAMVIHIFTHRMAAVLSELSIVSTSNQMMTIIVTRAAL